MFSPLLAKISPAKLRVEHNQHVHILSHRIENVVKRNVPHDNVKQNQLAERLHAEEKECVRYYSVFMWQTKWTGMLYIMDNYGNRLAVHHTDVIRA